MADVAVVDQVAGAPVRTPETASRTTLVAVGFYAISLACVIAVVVGFVGYQLSWSTFVSSYSLTNTAFAVFVPAAGVVLAVHRPRNPIGWLFIADGIAHGLTAAAVPYAVHGHQVGWGNTLMRSLTTLFVVAWPWGIGALMPLALQLFPTGRPLSARWRWLIVATCVNGGLFTLMSAGDPASDPPVYVRPWTAVSGFHDADPVWFLVNLLTFVVFALTLTTLVLRYRRGSEQLRRQLLWLLTAVAFTLLLNIDIFVTGDEPIPLLLSFALIPTAVVIAILRYQLLDIRLVVSRTVLYVLLTGLVVGAYVGIVTASDAWLHRFSRPVAALVIAFVFNPVRARMQRIVDRFLYGVRNDPMRAVAAVGEQLRSEGEDLPQVLNSARTALRLGGLQLRTTDGVVASSGVVGNQPVHALPLAYAGRQIGELVVGLRSGERRLDPADERVLLLLAAPLAVALHAMHLATEVQSSRERIVAAREEERRRLRRDLHDGLGPVLTGVALKADAARNVAHSDPEQARDLLGELRAETTGAISEIRRLVYNLRPPALDELGLVEAVRRMSVQFAHGADRPPLIVSVLAPADLPQLSAAAEVAAYRIISEALNNVSRHSNARAATVSIAVDDALRISVTDDGGAVDGWTPGVGLTSMRERAAELGGVCTAGPGREGWQVEAALPLIP